MPENVSCDGNCDKCVDSDVCNLRDDMHDFDVDFSRFSPFQFEPVYDTDMDF